jgi:hypothetical protein
MSSLSYVLTRSSTSQAVAPPITANAVPQLDPVPSVRAGNQHSVYLHPSGHTSARGSIFPGYNRVRAAAQLSRICLKCAVGNRMLPRVGANTCLPWLNIGGRWRYGDGVVRKRESGSGSSDNVNVRVKIWPLLAAESEAMTNIAVRMAGCGESWIAVSKCATPISRLGDGDPDTQT